MPAVFWVWALAWVGSCVLASVLLAEVWIRLRDNYRRDGIDLDEMDRPSTTTCSCIDAGLQHCQHDEGPTPQPRWVAYSGETLPQQPAPARVHPEITGGSP